MLHIMMAEDGACHIKMASPIHQKCPSNSIRPHNKKYHTVLHLLKVSFSEYEDFGRFAKDQSILPSDIS